MADLFPEKAQEDIYLKAQEVNNVERSEYQLASQLYYGKYGRSLEADVNRARTDIKSEEASVWSGVGKVMDWVLTPLTAGSAAILAPIGHEYKSSNLDAVWEGVKVSGEAFAKTLIPGWGDDEKHDYAMQVVEKFGLGNTDFQKTSIALGLDLLSDPTILLGAPALKALQGGLKTLIGAEALSDLGKIRSVRRLERAAASGTGFMEATAESSGVSELVNLAKKADLGDKEAGKEFIFKLNDSIDVARITKNKEVLDQSRIIEDFQNHLGLPDNELYHIDKNVHPDDLLKSAENNVPARSANFNMALIETDTDAETVFANMDKIFDRDYDAILKSLSSSKRKIMEESQNLLLGDFLKANVETMDPRMAYKGRQFLATMGDYLSRSAKAATHGNAYERLAFNRAVVLTRLLHQKVKGVARVYGRNLWSLSLKASKLDDKALIIKQLLDETLSDRVSSKLMEKLAAATEGHPDVASRIVEQSVSKTTADAMYEIYTGSLLSGMTTHAVNLTGTAFRLAIEPLKHGLASAAAIARADLASASEHFSFMARQLHGMAEGFVDAIRLAGKDLTHGKIFGDYHYPVRVDKGQDLASLKYNPAISGDKFGLTGPMGKVADYLGHGIRLSGSTLMREDQFMKVIAYRMDVNAYASQIAKSMGKTSDERRMLYQLIKRDPPTSIKQMGIKAADEYTFHTKLGDLPEKWNSVIKTQPGFRWLIPFFRTPTNLVNQGLTHTPFGVLYRGIRHDLLEATPAGDLARVQISLGPMMAGGLLSFMGENVTGRIDTRTPNGRFQQNHGAPAYSIKVGGKWYSYANIEPLRFMIGSAISVRDVLTHSDILDPDEENRVKQAVSTLTGVMVGTATDNFMLRQMGDIYGMLWSAAKGNPDNFLSAMANITVAMRRPQLVAQWEKQRDGYYRIADTYLQKVMKRTWGLSDRLFAYRDAYGNKVQIPHGLGPDIVSPIRWREGEQDGISEEIIKLKVNIGGNIKKIQGVLLNPEERDFVNKIAGQGYKKFPPVRKTLRKLMNSTWWPRMNPNQRKIAIENIFNGYRDMARNVVYTKSIRLQDEIAHRQQLIQGVQNDIN